MLRVAHQRSQTRQVCAYRVRVDSAWAASSAAANRTASSTVRPTGKPWDRRAGKSAMSVIGTDALGERVVVVMAGLYRRLLHSPSHGQAGGRNEYVSKR